MHRREDVVFTPVVRGQPGHDAPLLLHCHPGIADQKLILFLHGFGGRRYRTWGYLPGFLFEDCPDASVALYDYRSGSRALMPSSAIDLRDLARELADIIRDANFTRVVLIGHSMGGILAKAVVKELLESGSRCADDVPTIRRIAGVVLIATPQAGSLWVPPVLGAMTRNFRVLRTHSRFVSDLTETFRNRIDTSGRRANDPLYEVSIPTFGVIGLRDTLVDRLSSSLDLLRNQVKNVRATHKSIVKPKSRQDGAYAWILAKIQECFAAAYAGDAACRIDERVVQANRWSPSPRRQRLSIDSQKQLVWIDDPGREED
ncbi:esterase/lipase family protein [Micromonospora parva]|uniref:Esterase/lipase family protein n=1 Tax=Micromonospora parva TaxID=1464048 RepID=A0ABW6VMY0_9ACTN